jgi:hypothetical protein
VIPASGDEASSLSSCCSQIGGEKAEAPAASLPRAPQRSGKMLSDRKYEELVADLINLAREIANNNSHFLTNFRGFAEIMWSDDRHMKDVDASRNWREPLVVSNG